MKKTGILSLFLSILAGTVIGFVPAYADDAVNIRENTDQSGGINMQMPENAGEPEGTEKISVKALILPKFEVDNLSGDFPGEAQYYYENYLEGADAYEIAGGTEGSRLYVRDGVALYVLGMGKVNAALSTMAVLSDSRFDFSDAYVISTGCAGSAEGYGVMGDVFVISAAVDYDLGHHADARELADGTESTWFYDSSYEDIAVIRLDPELTDRVYDLVKDIPVKTTERTRNYMRAAFNGEEWAVRDPKVLKGTTVTGDNYWKGEYDHENALRMIETYGCPDPYALTEMEDAAVGTALKHMGMLDRYIIIRDSVNMDVFMLGATPESLWDPEFEEMSIASEDNVEAADIFETAMKNNFEVGKAVIDAILDGTLAPPGETTEAPEAEAPAAETPAAEGPSAGVPEEAPQSEQPQEGSLSEKWQEDFSRLAAESGMDICISALDLTSGETVSLNSDRKMLSASMIKVLIAETFLKQAAENQQSLDDVYVLKAGDIVGGTGSLGGRGAGAEVAKRELLLKMIAESDNTATNVLIDLCGMDAVNEEAARLGLKNTELGRHMMDTEAAEKGFDNYTCADDLAVLFKMVYDGTFVNEEMSRIMLECLEAQEDNECISMGLPEETVFAHKTGALMTVRHDGGIVEGDKPFILVTLCGGEGFYEGGALEAMKRIGMAAYKDIQMF